MKSDKIKISGKYGVFDNSLFMIRQAMETNPAVLWMTVLQALLVVTASLLELYGAPVILGRLERRESLGELLWHHRFSFPWGIMGSPCIVRLSGE